MAPVTAGDLLACLRAVRDTPYLAVTTDRGWLLLGDPRPVPPFLVFTAGAVKLRWEQCLSPDLEVQVLRDGSRTPVTGLEYLPARNSSQLPLLVLETP